MDKIQVLMSTYNGEKYLFEQVDSIFSQKDVSVSLLIRDDGSTDNTLQIIKILQEKYSGSITFYAGDNIGVKASFLDLVQKSNANFDFYAFADQDDVWLPSKLSVASSRLKSLPDGLPGLFCSRTQLTDDRLNYLSMWPPIPRRPLAIRNALVENVVVGCTAVINRSARSYLREHMPRDNGIIMHDWWVYLCITYIGQVIFEETPLVLYRQHSNNLIGGELSFFSKWKNKITTFIQGRNANIRSKQAEEFYFLNNNETDLGIVKEMIDYKKNIRNRIRFLIHTRVYRQSSFETLYLKILILFKRL